MLITHDGVWMGREADEVGWCRWGLGPPAKAKLSRVSTGKAGDGTDRKKNKKSGSGHGETESWEGQRMPGGALAAANFEN